MENVAIFIRKSRWLGEKDIYKITIAEAKETFLGGFSKDSLFQPMENIA